MPFSITRVVAAHMLWALEILHVRSINEIPCLLDIPTANRSAPVRTHVMPIGLQDEFFPLKFWVRDSSADVAHGDGEGAFPGGTLSPGVCPLILEC